MDAKNPLPLGESGRGPGEGKQAKPALAPHLLALARQLRKEQTNAEQLLWHLLRSRQFGGLKFRRQYPVAPYVLDFYCHEARLAIEVDGGQHNEPDRERRDAERATHLGAQGITVIRFWNHEVLQETEAVLEQLHDALTPTLSRRERGQKERLFPNLTSPDAEGLLSDCEENGSLPRHRLAAVRGGRTRTGGGEN